MVSLRIRRLGKLLDFVAHFFLDFRWNFWSGFEVNLVNYLGDV